MQVFRVCDKLEIDKIFSDNSFKNIGVPGKMYKRDPDEVTANTHSYEEDEMYMHFFSKFGDLFYINMEAGRYVCVYDIPDDVLAHGVGTGDYMDLFTYSIPRKVPEYCINSSELKFDYLQRVDLIIHDITYIDFLSEEILDDYFESIYSKGSSILRK